MIIKVHPDNPGEHHLEIITGCLRNGGVIIYPTDTVYGMGCDITNSKAVGRVAQIKGIKREKANFSFICHSLSHITDFTRPIPTPVFKLMRRALPGPFTFILMANSNVPRYFESKKKTIGIRIPDHRVPLMMVEMLGNPVMTTSIHGEDEIVDYLTDPELIYEKFQNQVDLVIDSGPGGIVASTVVDCTGEEPVVLRQGKGIISNYI